MSKTQEDPSPTSVPEKLASDLLFGAGAFAAELGIDRRRAFYLLERRLIPASKTGRIWTGSRRALRKHFASETVA
jgi:hypothetical protein